MPCWSQPEPARARPAKRHENRQNHGEASIFLDPNQTHKYGNRYEAEKAGNHFAHQVAERIPDQRRVSGQHCLVADESLNRNAAFWFGLANHEL
jgi:hypothetical protein